MDDEENTLHLPEPERRATLTRRKRPTRRDGDPAPLDEFRDYIAPIVQDLVQIAVRDGIASLAAVRPDADLRITFESTCENIGRQYQEAMSEVITLRQRVSSFESEMDNLGVKLKALDHASTHAKLNVDRLVGLSDGIEFVAHAIENARKGKGGGGGRW